LVDWNDLKSEFYVLRDEYLNIYTAMIEGEPYHPKYQKHKDLFFLLAQADLQTYKKLRTFFREQGTYISNSINWNRYNAKTASITDWVSDEVMSLFKAGFMTVVASTLAGAINAGGQSVERDLKIPIGWSMEQQPAIEFLNQYVLKLATPVTKVTSDRILSSLKTSITLGENQDTAKERIFKVISDERRAATIAHTESVRAYAGGRLMVADMVGATHKRWDATVKPCPICSALDGQTVKLHEQFRNGSMTYGAPPSHPNCRCLVEILLPNEVGQVQPPDVKSILQSIFF